MFIKLIIFVTIAIIVEEAEQLKWVDVKKQAIF